MSSGPREFDKRNEFSSSVPTVLFAEHDRETCSSLVHRLRNDGCLVLEAQDGVEALEIARVHSRPIHLMVTGVDMDGRTLAATLKHFRPQMEVMFLPVCGSIIVDEVLARIREALQPKPKDRFDAKVETDDGELPEKSVA